MKVTFLALFEIAAYTEASVAEMLVSHNMEEGWSWDIQFQHDFNDWEIELVGAFFTLWSHKVLQVWTGLG